MPALLSEAFKYHGDTSQTTSSSIDDLKSPFFNNTYQTQSATHHFNIPDVDNSVEPNDPIGLSLASTNVSEYRDPYVINEPHVANHDCSDLVYKLLACQTCRKRAKDILFGDTSPGINPRISGGDIYSTTIGEKLDSLLNKSKDNITLYLVLIGILIILSIDLLVRIVK